MRPLVVGLGSIGSLHAQVLADMGLEPTVVTSREDSPWPRLATLGEALDARAYDYVVIATPTAAHHAAVRFLIERGFSGLVLVEKPLFTAAQPLPTNSFAGGGFVGYNLRFHPLLAALRARASQGRALSAHVYAGQYLPSWRPGDYRRCYSARRAGGGGVLRDLSHELDYLTWILGPWQRVAALGGKVSDLEIETDDLYCVLFETVHGTKVELELNYLDRRARRELVLNLQGATARADFITGGLEWNGEEVVRHGADRVSICRAQHEALLAGRWDSACTFAEGLDTVRFIEAIESAAAKGEWIRR